MDDLISRQEAIEAMEQAKKQYFDRKVIICKMQDIVINLPSAQPEKVDTPTVDTPTVDTPNCDDTISRQAAIDAFYKHPNINWTTLDVLAKINALPPAQHDLSEYSDKLWQAAYERGKAEAQPDLEEAYICGETEAEARFHAEIIACGDCKHWICHERRCGYWNHGVKPLDWCCHAERRTDDR